MSVYNKTKTLFSFFFLVFCGSAFSVTTYWYSISPGNGVWTAVGNWSYTLNGSNNGTTPNYNSMSAQDNVSIETNITLTGNLTVVANSVLLVTNSKTLTINGNVDFQNGCFVTVDPGATLTINGNLNNSNNSNGIVDNGTINVSGNVTGGNGSTIVATNGNNGILNVLGSVLSNGTGSIFGSTADCPTGPCYSSANSPLPIKLIYFRGVHTGSSVKLNWATATETNNDYFTIERSVNGVDFSFVQKIKGAGNSTALLYYNTQDNNPVNGIGYYRLKQTDYDGKYSYSNLVAVNSFAEGNLSFSVFPNPAQDGETSVIQITDKANGEFVISIHDAIGKERYSKAVMTSNENSSYSLNVPKGLAPGLYFVTATSGNDVYSRKLIVK